jgi:DNA-binding CsgD family transcriptional regulator
VETEIVWDEFCLVFATDAGNNSVDPLYFSGSNDSQNEQIFTHPYESVPLLIEAANSDLIVYTHDMERRLTYMSGSSWKVCKLDFKNWHRKSFVPMFTDHQWNEIYKNTVDASLNPNAIEKIYCEIYDDEGGKACLEVRRSLILRDNEPIGVVGVTKRISVMPPTDLAKTPEKLDPFAILSKGEREVIELVIEGEMNKSIAKTLGLAIRTVETRRAKAMIKLRVRSMADLVKLWCQTKMT